MNDEAEIMRRVLAGEYFLGLIDRTLPKELEEECLRCINASPRLRAEFDEVRILHHSLGELGATESILGEVLNGDVLSAVTENLHSPVEPPPFSGIFSPSSLLRPTRHRSRGRPYGLPLSDRGRTLSMEVLWALSAGAGRF